MRTEIKYEWCYETLDEHGDIIENDFDDCLANFQENRKTDTLCLLRREGNEEDSETDRFYAYVENGKLPEWFSDVANYPTGLKVPQRFHAELAASNSRKN